jgi:hypothetical protein
VDIDVLQISRLAHSGTSLTLLLIAIVLKWPTGMNCLKPRSSEPILQGVIQVAEVSRRPEV